MPVITENKRTSEKRIQNNYISVTVLSYVKEFR